MRRIRLSTVVKVSNTEPFDMLKEIQSVGDGKVQICSSGFAQYCEIQAGSGIGKKQCTDRIWNH